MKELTIEEKAKRYDYALTKARNIVNSINVGLIGKDSFEAVFPELKESEDDKIRKSLIKAFNAYRDPNYEWGGVLTKDIIAWLEKQGEQMPVFEMKTPEESLGIDSETYNKIVDECIYGEQKPADKVEPKFKIEEGKWYVCISQYCNCIKGRIYRATSDSRIIDGFGTEYDMHNDAYKYFRLWTIQDAKDGDVLATKSGTRIFLYNGNCDLRHRPCAYCGTYKGFSEFLFSKCSIGNYFTDEDTYPATKEQRDLLFQKMHEAGYEWYAEKKELKKIEQKPKKCIYSKDNYTDEDRLVLCDGCNEICKLKQNPTWNEEDEINKDLLYNALNQVYDMSHNKDLSTWINKRILLCSKQLAWSEEDEKHLNRAINILDASKVYTKSSDKYEDTINWLKSLRPQNTWKPSDEQIEILDMVLSNESMDDNIARILQELREQLKKLK